MPEPQRVLFVHQRASLPWMFDGAAGLGVQVTLIPRPDERIDPGSLPPVVTDVLRTDIWGDQAAALSDILRYHESRPFSGVVTVFDPVIPFTARVAAALGLPGLAPEVADVVCDKGRVRSALAAAGCNAPAFVTVEGPQDVAYAAALRFPVVVKPASGVSSIGVTRVDDPADLPEVMRNVLRIRREQMPPCGAAGLVVEEFIDGPEYVVESLSWRGEVRVLSIGYKGQPEGPYFEEGVYRAPAPLPPRVEAAIVDEVTAVHAALGLGQGPSHTELRLRGGTEPYVFDLGARVGGSGVSHHVVEGVTGIEYAAETIRVAMGHEPACWPAPTPRRGAAANFIVQCGGTGRIEAINGLDKVAADPRVDRVVQMLFPGDVVRPYPDFSGYPAFVLSRHPDIADAERFHAALGSDIEVRYAPMPG